MLKAVHSIAFDKGRCLVLVVDDGSEQPLQLNEIQAVTPHAVKLITLEANRGITTALNVGLKWIVENTSVPYIARLDAADICHPERFYKQVALMEANRDVGLSGTWCRFENEKGSVAYNYTTPTRHRKILRALAFRNVFIHPTILFRASLLKKAGLYPDVYPHAEDYALCWTMARSACAAIIPEVLVTCAITRGISRQNRKVQLQSRRRVVQDFERNPLLRAAGLLKLWLLMRLPYSMVLKWKRRTY